jgi:hypothetical protein
MADRRLRPAFPNLWLQGANHALIAWSLHLGFLLGSGPALFGGDDRG